MTRYFWGVILASGIIVGQPSSANAQFSLSIGNPYLGSGLGVGGPSYGYGYNSYSSYGIGNGIYGAPIVASPYVGNSFGYNSGYAGYAPAVVRPAVPYYGGGYNRYGYGSYARPYGGYRAGGVYRGYGGYRR